MNFLAVFILCLALLTSTECQEDLPRVYIGTGVNGIVENSGNNEMIVLGGLFSIYENPGVNPRSIHRMEAVALAVEKINNDSTILPGVTLAFEVRATEGNVNTALEESIKYVSSRNLKIGNSTVLGISGVVGAGFSSVSTQVARLLRLFYIPQISYASTADVLSDKTTFDYFLRTVSPDSFQAQALADIVEYFNWTYVIAMHTNDVYGMGGIEAFIDEIGRRNSTLKCIATPISISLPRDSTAAEEFENALVQIDQNWINNATVIVLFATRNTGIGLLNAVKKKRAIDPKFAARNLTWIGSDGWGNNIPAELRETVQGSLTVAQLSASNDEFDQHFLSLNPLTHTVNPFFNQYWEEVFNCSLNLERRPGFEQCDLNAQAFTLESTSLQTSTVTPAMDAVYAFANAIHNLQQDSCGGGQGLCQEILTNRSGGVAINGELLLNYVRNVSFSPGLSTEVVSFNENGDPSGSSYVVSNVQQTSHGNYSFETVGLWNGTHETPLEIFNEIQWNQGSEVPTSLCSFPCGDGEYPQSIAGQAECCWVCRPCRGAREFSNGRTCQTCPQGEMPNERRTGCVLIPISFLTWSHAWSIVILLLTCAGIIATITVAVIFIVYRNHRIVKASSRELTAVLLSGIMLCYLLPFFFIAKPTPGICTIRRFGIGFCFAMCYSALLVKTNRIHRIFNRKITSTEAPPLISPISQLFFTALLVSVQVVIAVIWLIVERPSISFRFSDFSTELICGESTLIEIAISLVYSFLLLIVTTYYAIRTRNVPQNFNEAKFISFTMYTLCVLWLAFIPIYFAAIARLGVIFQTGSLVLAIILNASVTLSCLFVPKIYFLFSTVHKDHTTHASQFETASIQKNLNASMEPRPSLPTVPAIKIPDKTIKKLMDNFTQTD